MTPFTVIMHSVYVTISVSSRILMERHGVKEITTCRSPANFRRSPYVSGSQKPQLLQKAL